LEGAEEMTTNTKEEPKVRVLRFGVIIIVDKDIPGYHAYAPSLKGLHMGGDTEKEARENAKEAAALYLKSLLKHGDPIPIDILDRESVEKTAASKKHISSRVEEIKVKL
jgi:predicted RNase H-like HicB family nuclease